MSRGGGADKRVRRRGGTWTRSMAHPGSSRDLQELPAFCAADRSDARRARTVPACAPRCRPRGRTRRGPAGGLAVSARQQPVQIEVAIRWCRSRLFRSSVAVVPPRPSRAEPAGLVVPFGATWRNGTCGIVDAEPTAAGKWSIGAAWAGIPAMAIRAMAARADRVMVLVPAWSRGRSVQAKTTIIRLKTAAIAPTTGGRARAGSNIGVLLGAMIAP